MTAEEIIAKNISKVPNIRTNQVKFLTRKILEDFKENGIKFIDEYSFNQLFKNKT